MPSKTHPLFLKRFFALTGLGYAKSFLQSFTLPLSLTNLHALYQENKAHEKELSSLGFDELLQLWKITTKEEEGRYMQEKKRLCLLGLALFLFGTLFLLKSILYPQTCSFAALEALANLSLALLGLLFFATALWRIHCLKKRSFQSFSSWLISALFHPKKSTK